MRTELYDAAAAYLQRAERLERLNQPLEALALYRQVAKAMGAEEIGRRASRQAAAVAEAPETVAAEQQRQGVRVWRSLLAITATGPREDRSDAERAPVAAAADLADRIAALPDARKARALAIVDALCANTPDCPVGRAAMELRLRLHADTDVPDRVASYREAHEAGQLLLMARNYSRARRPAIAARLYRDFLAAHPDDPRAADVRELLRELASRPGRSM